MEMFEVREEYVKKLKAMDNLVLAIEGGTNPKLLNARIEELS
jgi:hypothetical protein